MSFGLPSIKVKSAPGGEFSLAEGPFGVPELMKNGLTTARAACDDIHPIAYSEKHYEQNRDNFNMAILRNTQGLHAPLRIAMELKSAQKIGRLPFLRSSNAMLDSLTGRDLEIMPEDIFNSPELFEMSAQPHAVVEKSLGIL
ncbi:proteasome maturation protein [Cylas formicarius]|uniref:proteasome maturation protein n=1 Tax=Cylas formicarius TaxID=197179 RepID=UPI002958BE59|nr:proteasome maturation protein [Cylas formicarius]